MRKLPGYWTYEHCYEEAMKYNSRKEFSDKCNRAYLVSLQNGWINDYTWFNKNN